MVGRRRTRRTETSGGDLLYFTRFAYSVEDTWHVAIATIYVAFLADVRISALVESLGSGAHAALEASHTRFLFTR